MRRKKMRTVRVSDVTLKQKTAQVLSFREKIELVKLLDKLQADVIELPALEQIKADSLFIKSVGNAVKDSVIAVETECDSEKIDMTWKALQTAAKPRIQIKAPVSLVQMEYLYHKKPEAVKAAAAEAVAYAKTLTEDVEFAAEDATRSERAFLYDILETVVKAGASTVTVCDTAGEMLPGEFAAFIKDVKTNVPSLNEAVLGFACSNDLSLADACSIAGIFAGAGEVKASVYPEETASLGTVANVIRKKGTSYDTDMNVRTVELKRLSDQAARMFTAVRSKTTPFETGVREDISGRFFTVNDDITAVSAEVRSLGYDLSEEDQVKVYEAFKVLAERKEKVSAGEIDAIVASNAMQVPPVYKVEDYIITGCSMLSATAHIRLRRNDEILESVALGDGPVDASFLAIEQILGRHYELDDFQIQAVTEGREAMGEAIVKLRCLGKIYSGRGLSTDIVGSSISAYVNALNKIVYEEETE